MRISVWSSNVCSSDLNLFSCAVGVPAACLPSGVPRVFLFQPDGTLRESNYGTDFRPVGSGNNQGGDGSTLNDTGTLQPDYKRYIANFLAHYDVSEIGRASCRERVCQYV